ncbi:hypothetical protein ACT29H_06770 [Thermophagus sp. OGC60D27]|uniref:hypothetical protein n=1 Tax=Thermophagus sp. OGC60D27 TaxID=3458415 RepID=UPI0040378A88
MLKFLPLILLLFLTSFSAEGEPEDSLSISSHSVVRVWDEGKVNVRSIPLEKINDWSKQSRYKYDRDQGPNFLEYILMHLVGWLILVADGRPWFFYLFLALGGLFVIFLLLRFLDVPFSRLFMLSRRQNTATLQFGIEDQKISAEKLHEMLRLYRSNGVYREAVRVLFLLYLQELQKRGEVVLRNYKTNLDYFREIGNRVEKEKFQKCSHLFEVIWYGHIDISGEQYEMIESSFKEKRGGELK